ncbi:MAG TPA: glutamine-hydrolyzing carbamoyl-phosphate synthase small subunit [Negativicutes bacterium]|nr:glutamine-hydrolyzing carbamoyl-phosphate synthase small subunit [Negativicutes bacterium]
MDGYLLLEDGFVYKGKIVGAADRTRGEVVFNTGMTGYQEIMTDPSYRGQIVVMTYPLIGNYGINSEDVESYQPHVQGFVAREFCREPQNWRCEQTVDTYLREKGITGLVGVDTRALTRHLRQQGVMKGIITAEEPAATRAAAWQWTPRDLVREVAVPQPQYFAGERQHVVLVDCGVKENILRSLRKRGCAVTVVPPWTTAEEILASKPDGVLLSNGPGDPEDLGYLAATVGRLLGKVVIFGICLGHQVLGIALGGKTYKLKFGHRGVNHPVKDLETGRVYITSQNHGYAIDAQSLPATAEVTQLNLNDHTVEGIKHKTLPVFAVQYHPEASPGPDDAAFLFDRFIALMQQERGHKQCQKRAI